MPPVYLQLLILVMFIVQRPLLADDAWDFTTEDYARLLDDGGALYLSDDSQWFPESLRPAFLKALDFILSQRDGVKRTEGIRYDDFYHGHLLCEGYEFEPIYTQVLLMDRALDREKRTALGADYPDVTHGNMHAVKAVVERYESIFARYANLVLAEGGVCRNPALLFHTYEENKPEDMRYGDARRNTIVFLSTGEPQPYQLPDIDYGSSYEKTFTEVLQFNFLGKENGEIFITAGSSANLPAKLLSVMSRARRN